LFCFIFSVVPKRFITDARYAAKDKLNEIRKVSDQQNHQLRDYRLTTAEIIYHLPDHPDLLQSFIWQKLDLAPDFPELRRFLEFWSRNLEGKLHSVRVGQARYPGRPRFRHVTICTRLN
jgi:uncharacterized protein Usg